MQPQAGCRKAGHHNLSAACPLMSRISLHWHGVCRGMRLKRAGCRRSAPAAAGRRAVLSAEAPIAVRSAELFCAGYKSLNSVRFAHERRARSPSKPPSA